MSAPDQWIPAYLSLSRHPKTKRLQRTLGLDSRSTVGGLVLAWQWAFEFAPDGDVTEFMADISDAFGTPGAAEAMLDAGFLCLTPEGRTVIHDWLEYAGKATHKRAADATRKRDARRTSGGHPSDIRRTSAGLAGIDKTRQEEKKESLPSGETRAARKVDPLLLTPEWKLFRRTVGDEQSRRIYPSARAKVVEAIRGQDEAKVIAVLRAWGEHGYRTENVTGWSSWIVEGIPTNGNGRPAPKPAPVVKTPHIPDFVIPEVHP